MEFIQNPMKNHCLITFDHHFPLLELPLLGYTLETNTQMSQRGAKIIKSHHQSEEKFQKHPKLLASSSYWIILDFS